MELVYYCIFFHIVFKYCMYIFVYQNTYASTKKASFKNHVCYQTTIWLFKLTGYDDNTGAVVTILSATTLVVCIFAACACSADTETSLFCLYTFFSPSGLLISLAINVVSFYKTATLRLMLQS